MTLKHFLANFVWQILVRYQEQDLISQSEHCVSNFTRSNFLERFKCVKTKGSSSQGRTRNFIMQLYFYVEEQPCRHGDSQLKTTNLFYIVALFAFALPLSPIKMPFLFLHSHVQLTATLHFLQIKEFSLVVAPAL